MRAQLCPILCDPMDCSPLGSSVHEIFQAKILEWIALSYSTAIYTVGSREYLFYTYYLWCVYIYTYLPIHPMSSFPLGVYIFVLHV